MQNIMLIAATVVAALAYELYLAYPKVLLMMVLAWTAGVVMVMLNVDKLRQLRTWLAKQRDRGSKQPPVRVQEVRSTYFR